jgi:hypothetical protein
MKKLNAEDYLSALRLLDQIERWGELGVSEFLPEFCRGMFNDNLKKITEFLDRTLGPKSKRGKFK